MFERTGKFYSGLLSGAALLSLAFAGVAHAEIAEYKIPPQPLDDALQAFSRQSGHPMIVDMDLVRQKRSPGAVVSSNPETALRKLLTGTGLDYRRDGEVFAIVAAQAAPAVQRAPQPTIAAGTVSGSAVEGLVVTAQKRREAIQDVPIAISAFNADALQAQKIEGGFDLLKAIPNVTFSKNNFSGYNFSIRGIGTKAISVTTDPGVAVSFNNVTLIRNRLFEQEYFDVERVEVLRGPQGTLYGRNATSGVVNLISAKPDMDAFSGSIKGEVGNYDTKRLVAMLNVPLISDTLAVRLAGSMTSRDGYDTNLYNNEQTNGRDLWSARLTIGFTPTERIHADLIWERFEEDDNRARTGKQLCTHDAGPSVVDGFDLSSLIPSDITEPNALANAIRRLAVRKGGLSQGCLPGSLYDDKAFGTPNGLAIPFIGGLAEAGMGYTLPNDTCPIGCFNYTLSSVDPYGNTTQSRDLRTLYSQIKPVYRAKADIFELNFDFDLTPTLTLSSQTAYNRDEVYSTQDFNRYTTLPAFGDSNLGYGFDAGPPNPENVQKLLPNGVFCDPQLGCSNTIVGQDLSRAKSSQFSQELRLQSDFDGPLNFSAGLGYTRYRTTEDYYVFFNGITLAAIELVNSAIGPYGNGNPDRYTITPDCANADNGPFGPEFPNSLFCVPIENNPISNIQDTGHNYFLSRNPYGLNSKAAFGELYWQAADTVKITAGLRYTDDEKTTTPIPSETLLTPASRIDAFLPLFGEEVIPFLKAGALSSFGSGAYPTQPEIHRQWKEVTGRLGVDWKPALSFTDQTLLYAFYSRGYKGGGMNPPPVGVDFAAMIATGRQLSPTAPPEFQPEFVNAFEIGAKNTLLGGGLVLNGNVFFYDYKDYQVSKIVDRSANNENFDAKVWGLELEGVFQPTPDLRFNAALGYLDTELAEGSKSIDIMNRTGGNPGWLVVKPFITMTSNCIAPAEIVRHILEFDANPDLFQLCPPLTPYTTFDDLMTWDPSLHPEINFGAGFDTDVSGNELPNSPHFTVSLGGEYSWDVVEGWNATVRGDFYWQSQQWARVYELPIDKLHAWSNTNLSLWVEKPDEDLKIEFYVKNVFDETPITDTFTNSDDTALTTNIFVLDPRLIGLQITKGF